MPCNLGHNIDWVYSQHIGLAEVSYLVAQFGQPRVDEGLPVVRVDVDGRDGGGVGFEVRPVGPTNLR
jgi:hypothetical protein